MKNGKVEPRKGARPGGPASRALKRQARPRRRVDAVQEASSDLGVPEPVEPDALAHHSPYGVLAGDEVLPFAPRQPAWAWQLGWTRAEGSPARDPDGLGAKDEERSGAALGRPDRRASDGAGRPVGRDGMGSPRTNSRPLAGPSTSTSEPAPPGGKEGSLAERAARARQKRADRMHAISAYMERLASVAPVWARDDAHRSIVQSHATLRRLKLAIQLRRMIFRKAR